MSLLSVVENSGPTSQDAWTDPTQILSVVSSGIARWSDPSAQHVAWRLRLTNTGDVPILGLTALFAYAGPCRSTGGGLAVTSTSSRVPALRSWGRGTSLAKAYPETLAAWETLLVTAVHTSPSNASGTVTVSFGVLSSDVELGTLSADF